MVHRTQLKRARSKSSRAPELIVALDCSAQKARHLVAHLGKRAEWYKVGPVLFTAEGPHFVRWLVRQRKHVFLDLKLYDIPSVVAKTISQLAQLKVKLATLHCQGGLEMLRMAQHAAEGTGLRLVGVTQLTSSRAKASTLKAYVSLAVEANLAGAVCSVRDIDALKSLRTGKNWAWVTPGIRLEREEEKGALKLATQARAGNIPDDQNRTATPRAAKESGVTYIVVGRPILTARRPAAVVDSILSELQ